MKIKKISANTEVVAEDIKDTIEPEVQTNDELSPFISSRKAIMEAMSQLQRVVVNKPDYADKAKEAIANLSVIYFDLRK